METTANTTSVVNTTAVYVYELVCQLENVSEPANSTNCSSTSPPREKSVHSILMVISYIIICLVGLIGNGLVIYVVLRFSKMKTVTNLYILNLAISDVLFLIGLPFLITTTLVEHWMFGKAMCKIYYVSYSINIFTSVFTLTAMSADRYLAVCHPVRSVCYRTTRIAFFVCMGIWTVSFLVMLPIILYSSTVQNDITGKARCTIDWPDNQPIKGRKAFTWYTFLLGFLIPVALITVFYISVVLRLKSVGPRKKSKERKKSNRKVTRMVLAMISIYIICWLPYWCFQVNLTFIGDTEVLPGWQIHMFSAFTILSFANSAINPVLYAFLSEVFRKSFVKAFQCVTFIDSKKSQCADNSIFPRSTMRKENGNNEHYEFTSMVNQTENTCMHTNNAFHMTPLQQKSELNDNDIVIDEGSITYVDKEIQTNRRDGKSRNESQETIPLKP